MLLDVGSPFFVYEESAPFPNNLPSLEDYPELLDTLIIPQVNANPSSESDSDSTIILPHDVDSGDTFILSE
jgi:hypothetical protein